MRRHFKDAVKTESEFFSRFRLLPLLKASLFPGAGTMPECLFQMSGSLPVLPECRLAPCWGLLRQFSKQAEDILPRVYPERQLPFGSSPFVRVAYRSLPVVAAITESKNNFFYYIMAVMEIKTFCSVFSVLRTPGRDRRPGTPFRPGLLSALKPVHLR